MSTQSPFDELGALARQIEQAADLDGLKPVFSRLDQLSRLHSDNLDIQLQVDDLKQKVVERGKFLRHSPQTVKMTGPPPAYPPPPGPSLSTTGPMAVPPVPPRSAAPPPIRPDQPTEILNPSAAAPPAARSRPEIKIPAPGEQKKAQPNTEIWTGPPPVPPVAGGPPASSTRPAQGPPAPPSSAPPNASGAGSPPGQWRKPLVIGVLAGVALSIALIVLLVNQARKRNLVRADVALSISTVPPGASIRVNGEPQCNADCRVSLPPGNYQVTAFLDGFEPAATNVALMGGKPASITLPLEPQAPSLRVLTDLTQGTVALDDQAPLDLQDGQFVLDRVQAGTHKVKVTSKTGEATFTVEVAPGKMPVVSGPVSVKNLMAVLVSSMGNKARVVTNAGPAKLALNGLAQPDAGPDGVDLNGFQPGVDELLVGDGKEQRNMKESFSPAPALTAFFKSDLNIGTLIVSTGQDDVHVFVNNKEYARRTQKGQVRLAAIGPVTVRVEKAGFETAPPQTAEVKKGSEVRLEFKMQALPQMASLQVRGATPGAEVLLDQKSAGTVGDDGAFSSSAVPPGDHVIEIRRDQFLPKRLQRSFRAGQAVILSGTDVVLASALGTVQVARTPADAAIAYRRSDETQNHELRGNQVDLPPGAYIFVGRASGFTERTERVQVNAGESHTVEMALAKVVLPPPPPPKNGTIADFEDPRAWTQQDNVWTHQGGGYVFYKRPANGVFTFTVQLLKGGNLFRGGKIRWVFQYVDAKNYDLFELDKKTLSSKVIVDGKTLDRGKYEHNLSEKDKSYAIQIDSRPEHLVTKVMNGGEWKTVDSWDDAGRDFTIGKFGFLVQGNDQIGLTDFTFMPR